MRKLAANYGGAQRLGHRQQGSPEGRRARAHAGRGADPQPRQDHARGGAAEREGAPRWSTRSATRAPPRPTSSTWPTSPTPRTPSSCATCAPTSSTSSWASTRRPGANTWRSARRSRSASTTRTRCCRRWARSRRSRKPRQARDRPRATACSARPPTSTRRCSRRTRRSSTVIYKNGQFFFDYGDYDEAIKRFGLIVERYPDDPNAGPAGDRILQALNKAKNYENIEAWARRLKKTKAFSSKDEQERLDTLIVDSVMKSGEKYASDGNYDKAAAFYLRVPHEYPGNGLAPKALNNAGAVLEKAKKQDEAVAAYKELADKYPVGQRGAGRRCSPRRASRRTSPTTTRPRCFYEQLAQKYPQNPHAADALRSAGVLRQSLGQHDKAIKHYGEYAKRYKDKSDAKQVAFQAAVVREDQKDWRGAAAAFGAYAKTYPGRRAHRRGACARGRRPAEGGQRRGREGRRREGAVRVQRGGKHHKAARAPRTRTTGPPRRATSRASSSSTTTSASRSRASPGSSPRCSRRKPSAWKRRRASTWTSSPTSRPSGRPPGLLRIGQGYEAYAKAMRNAPVPKDLNADEKQMYRDELEKVVVVIEDKALDAYKSGYAKALTIGVYNKHTQAIRQALSRLAENEYPKEAEQRLSHPPGRAAHRARPHRRGAP